MAKSLVIVESPAKAKTIEKYLGSDFKVLSSVGHIRAIAKKAVDGKPPVDVRNGYETIYEVDPEKKKIIAELKKGVKESSNVWLATDGDREGEAIAWHLVEVLKLNPKTTKRIVFHEITKHAIEEAIKNPRTVDMNLVQAQQARQILDRLVGFELSPVVWRKVPGGKSAGRVQSPAVRLIVEREREIEQFEGSYNFKITAEFTHDKDILKAELPNKFESEKEAHNFLKHLINSSFSVANVVRSPGTRSPSAPFTTSTLQQEANSKLGFSAKATMTAAQKLYQEGKITYMRTDSVHLSDQALAASAAYIKSTYGEKYHQIRNFKTKNASAQEAHEAIRPTDVSKDKVSTNNYDQKLYNLIRNRTLASQMAPAKLEKTVITINITDKNGQKSNLIFEAKGEVIIFDGFLKVYGNKKDDDILPAITINDSLKLHEANARQVFARSPARYTEGSLVKKLEDLGIGRPSTYATIINTIQVRGYVEKGESEGQPRDLINLKLTKGNVEREILTEKTGANKGKLIPTSVGDIISDFLVENFDQVIDYGFTAKVEEDFDKIAAGALARNIMLDDFYKPFHKLIEQSGGIERSSVAKAREVGIDPKTGLPIFARYGRFGLMLQLGHSENKEEKPKFAPMPAGKKVETVTLEEALYAFKLPRHVGKTADGLEIKANIGRFGPYIQVDKLFVSIKPLDPHTIKLDEAIQLYEAKLKAEAEKNIADFGDGIKVLNGRYGPYITDGKQNIKVPKDVDPRKITQDQAKEILELASTTPKRKVPSRKKSAKSKKPTKKS